jgi:HrpA-like RNA helicase
MAKGTKPPTPFHGRHGYNPESVSKAIKNNRTGKIGKKEAGLIHRLLRGR